MNAEERQIIKTNRVHLEKIIDFNKLIQYLQKYKIFNRYMWKDIRSTSDVLEFLPTRGPKAFQDFIEILRKADYGTEASKLEQQISPLQLTDNLFYKMTDNLLTDNLFYKMSSTPLGYCLIINNMQFDDSELEYRHGSDIDEKYLKDFFKKAGFEVIVEHDMTSDEIVNYLMKFSKKDFSNVDSLILIIMSHGNHTDNNKEILYGKEGGFIYKEDVYDFFSNKNCETLQLKPKVFFFIACRGKGLPYGVPKKKSAESIDSNVIYSRHDKGDEILPELSDMLVINSTLPYMVTVRNHEKGTYFCQALIPVLNEKYKIWDLETMIKFVNQELEGKVSETYRITQAVHTESIMWKKKIMLC